MLRNVKENPIREKNRSAAIEYIIQEGKVSRAQIAGHLGVNKASISEIILHLLEYEIVEEIGVGCSSQQGGRKPVLLQLHKEACLFLSIDLGYNYIRMLLTYMNGEQAAYREYEHLNIQRDTIIEELKNASLEILQNAPQTVHGLKAVTLGIHGAVLVNGITFTPYYDLVHLPVKEQLQDILHVPVYYENEANLSAIANHALKDCHNMISISIHIGVGSGIITNDRLYRGELGFGGEIGHMILFPDGRHCPCGNDGCLETYCSQKAIEETFSTHFKKKMQLSDIRKLYDDLDPYTVEQIGIVGKYLSIGVNNLCVLFDPQILYFNCTLVCMFPDIIEEIRKHLKSFLSRKRIIEISPIAERSILIGGILVALKNSLRIEHVSLMHLAFDKS